MAERTIADIIAENQRNKLMALNLTFADDVAKAGLTSLAENSFLSRSVVQPARPITEAPPVLETGKEFRDRIEYLNLSRPDVYEIINLNHSFSANVIPSGITMETQFENHLSTIIRCNQYTPRDYDFKRDIDVNIKTSQVDGEQVPYPERYDFNFDVTQNQSLIDVFLGRSDIENTPLGIHGALRVRQSFEQNIEGNLVDQTSGRINNDLYSILNGKEVLRDYSTITIPRTKVGRAAEFLRKLSGYYYPINYIPDGASDSELLAYTGILQKRRLKQLLDQNDFRPELDDSTSDFDVEGNYYYGTFGTLTGDQGDAGFGVDYISPNFLDYNPLWKGKNPLTGKIYDRRCLDINDPNGQFVTWQENTSDTFSPKGILQKTQNLVNEKKAWIDQSTKEWLHRINGREYLISRGSSITAHETFETRDGTTVEKDEFFRAWTKARPYNRLSRAMRSSGLYKKDETRSVLQDNGLVKVAPIRNDKSNSNEAYYYTAGGGINIKKYMLSIENLAWTDFWSDLPQCEQGSGDIVSKHRGRQMWFAPYNLKFDESSSADWQSHEFIGRGEKMYTYSSSERTGNLSFTMVMDHPDVINRFKQASSQTADIDLLWERYHSGDEFIIDYVNNIKKSRLSPEQERLRDVVETVSTPVPQTVAQNIVQNDISIGTLTIGTVSNSLTFGIPENENKHNQIINPLLNDNNSKLIVEINPEEPNFDEVCTEAIAFIVLCYNQQLTIERGIGVDNRIPTEELTQSIIDDSNALGLRVSCVTDDNASLGTVNLTLNNGDPIEPQINTVVNQPQQTNTVPVIDREELAELIYEECDYFDYLSINQPLMFKTIKEKVDFFHPAFHSTTPQGFNSRLNFLQQCVRQGESIGQDGISKTRNLAFGRPPVCILRIGDFIHSRILINNVNFDYDGTGGMQWDVNPEGIGVQPMTVNVSMGIVLIGGQSLNAPINKIQNAMSYNFYANTEIYDNRADTVRVKSGNDDNIYVENRSDNRYREQDTELINQNGENGRQVAEYDETVQTPDTVNSGTVIDLNVDQTRRNEELGV